MTLGELIVRFREDHHMSQRQFALRCGLSNGYINMLEKGVNPQTGKPIAVGLDKFQKIAEAMGMTVHDLMRSVDGNTLVSMETVSSAGSIRDKAAQDTAPDWNPEDMAWAEQEDENTILLNRWAHKTTGANRQQLLDIIRVMFKNDFDEEGNLK